jgi:hypothetical protein
MDDALKAGPFVRTIAKRLGFGMAAPTEGGIGPSTEPEGFALGVDDLEVSFDFY